MSPTKLEKPTTKPTKPKASAVTSREATVERSTGETRIRATVRLDPPSGGAGSPRLEVPDAFFTHMLDALCVHSGLDVELDAVGDVEIDLHHTVEDVGIVLGEAVSRALGARRGIVRFAHAYVPLDEALSRAVVDVSGRGFFVWSAPAEIASMWATRDFPVTLVSDFFQAFADRARITLHLDLLAARNGHHAAESAFKAVGVALRTALSRRPGGGEAVPSTKGTLTK